MLMPNVFYAECHNEVHYTVCHYPEWDYAECRGAISANGISN